MYHKDHPWFKGLWIWKIQDCLDGTTDSIIKKCHDYDISYLIIKNGDGGTLWTQLNRETVATLQGAGIKVYSWSYNYGEDPQGEAAVAIQCLDLGVDGHVFDAEAEYRDAPNNGQAAELMLQTVRATYPDKFLAYAPFAIIDLHTKFPYVTFGKYCDAVMPQICFGTMKKTPQQAILWMYDNFVRWQQNWIDSGNAESVKPIIPIGQAYDNYDLMTDGKPTPYILTPDDIQAFIRTVAGYKSVCFFSFDHLLRDDCWAALRDTKVDAPSGAELGIVEPAPQETTPSEGTVETPITPMQETVPTVQATESTVTVVEEPAAAGAAPQEDITVYTPLGVTDQVAETIPSSQPDTTPTQPITITPQNQPKQVELPANLLIPSSKPTTVTFRPNKDDPEKVDVVVHAHKIHREYFVEFCHYAFAVLQRVLKTKVF